MKLLLDTHTLIWVLADDPTLRPAARAAIVDPENLVFVSAVSVWEMAIKRGLGKLRVPDDVNAQITAHRFDPLAVTCEHAWAAGNLPDHHADPFDRMLISQAHLEGLTVVTRDRRFEAYGVASMDA